MTRQTLRLPLPNPAPGTERSLLLHRYGVEGARPKAYIQASLHADETPAMLVAQHLLGLLEEADREGRILGEILVVPYANPIGLAQWLSDAQLGRYDLRGAGNFNRAWPDLTEPTATRLAGRLGSDPTANVAAVRAAMGEALAAFTPRREVDALKLTLLGLSHDADLVLDLHCDDESLLHLFIMPQHWPEAADLAAALGVSAVLLAEDSGGNSFDEMNALPWVKLARRFPDHPIPPVCLGATVELRGRPDVFDELAAPDAAALLRVLVGRGLVAGEAGPLPESCAATELTACETLRSPAAGILAYKAGLGDRVQPGQAVAELVDPAADPGAPRRVIRAGTEGFVLSRRQHKFVAPGQTVAKIVGERPLPDRVGYLLED